jgi:hypothetical protein
VPQDTADFTMKGIRGWARLPNRDYLQAVDDGWAWLNRWPSTMLSHRGFIWGIAGTAAAIGTVATALRLYDRFARPPATQPRGTYEIAVRGCPGMAITICTGLLGIAYWFLSAPDPRFGLGFLIATPLLGATALLYPALVRRQKVWLRWAPRVAAPFVAICLILSLNRAIVDVWSSANWPKIPRVSLVDRVSKSGVSVSMPAKGEQCWDAPPPCTPYLDRRIREGRIGIWRVYYMTH